MIEIIVNDWEKIIIEIYKEFVFRFFFKCLKLLFYFMERLRFVYNV